MPYEVDLVIHSAALLIEFGGSLLVVLGCFRGLYILLKGGLSHGAIVEARLIVADSIIAALGFKTAASLLKTTELQSWQAIAMFAAIFAIRTVVKRALQWEERRLRLERAEAAKRPVAVALHPIR